MKPKEYWAFLKTWALLIDCGVAIIDCFDALIQQAKTVDKNFADVLENIKEQISSGKTITKAIEAHPQYFGPCLIAMINAGERGGILDTVFNHYANLYREEIILSKKKLDCKTETAIRFVMTMEALIRVGTPILDALAVAAKRMPNPNEVEKIGIASKLISQRTSIGRALADTELLPPHMNQLLIIAEATGSLDVIFTQIKNFYFAQMEVAAL